MGFIFLYQLSSETYPTKIRATGLGLSIAIGRIGVIVMPWTVMYLVSMDLLSPYVLFSILSGVGVGMNVFMPADRKFREH